LTGNLIKCKFCFDRGKRKRRKDIDYILKLIYYLFILISISTIEKITLFKIINNVVDVLDVNQCMKKGEERKGKGRERDGKGRWKGKDTNWLIVIN
jgi:hypothetical protein